MKRLSLLLLMVVIATLAGAKFSVAILITGEIGGNAIYELVQKGALEIESDEIAIKIVEGG